MDPVVAPKSSISKAWRPIPTALQNFEVDQGATNTTTPLKPGHANHVLRHAEEQRVATAVRDAPVQQQQASTSFGIKSICRKHFFSAKKHWSSTTTISCALVLPHLSTTAAKPRTSGCKQPSLTDTRATGRLTRPYVLRRRGERMRGSGIDVHMQSAAFPLPFSNRPQHLDTQTDNQHADGKHGTQGATPLPCAKLLTLKKGF